MPLYELSEAIGPRLPGRFSCLETASDHKVRLKRASISTGPASCSPLDFFQRPVTNAPLVSLYRQKGEPVIIENSKASEVVADLFQRYGKEVYEHVYLMLGITADAEDMTQEVFLRVLRGWGQFRHASSVRTWIWSITRNCLREYYRQNHHDRMRTTALSQGVAVATYPPSSRFSTAELVDALQALPTAQRQVFICRAIQGLSSKETAAMLGWSDVLVRVTLHRATKRLREVLFDD